MQQHAIEAQESDVAMALLQWEGPRRTRATKFPPILHSLLQNKIAALGVFIVLGMILVAIFAPFIAPHHPGGEDVSIGEQLRRRLMPPAWAEGGESEFLLGTDSLGRDILSRIIYGSRVSLTVGFTAVALSGTIGVILGLISGYSGGLVDDVIMRIADVWLAFPFLILAILFLSVLGAGLDKLIAVLALGGWVGYARVTRGQVLAVREKEYVDAAHALGVPRMRILFRHIMPNTLAPIIVISSFAVATTMLAEAALSFLGLGVKPAIPTWGSMLADGRDYLRDAWWLATFPGIAIMITVLGINLFGDWLRDYLDPRLKV
jgi:peptide/nickel transport system permease protein